MPRSGPSTPPPPSRPRSLGERIRTLRMAWGWTQEQLGRALNTDQTAVSAWERDRARPSGAALSAIARLAGISVEVLTSEGPLGGNLSARPELASTPREHTLTLKDAGAGTPLQFVDLNTDQQQPLLDSQEAMLKLIEATRQGRRVWLVVD
ncbi:MAG TPA: helix-turn-helix transcriptional regulator [Holophaga sp.]|nr:helix-turn-helix transcriptional regulator [Holophaga sp.]